MTRLIILVGFIFAFAAGWMIGSHHHPRLSSPTAPQQRPGDRGSWLVEQLQLTPEQQQSLREIWSEVARGGGRQQAELRRQLRRDREEALARLIRDDDRGEYERIVNEFNAKNAELDTEWRQAYEQAVERTKSILTPEQQAKYESILSRQGWDGPPGRDRPRPGPRPPEGRPDGRPGPHP